MVNFAPLDNAGRIAGAGAAAGSRIVGADSLFPRVDRREKSHDDSDHDRDGDTFEHAEDEQVGYHPPTAATPAAPEGKRTPGVEYLPSGIARPLNDRPGDDDQPHIDVVA